LTGSPVTLLFTDLVNSTELLARAGDEPAGGGRGTFASWSSYTLP